MATAIKTLLLSLLVPLCFLAVGVATLEDYGETTDEKFDQHIGEYYYYQWSQTGYQGLLDRFRELQRNYGPLFDVIVVAAHDHLHKRRNLVSAVASYHVPVLISAVLTIWLVFWFGRALAGSAVGFLAQLNLALMPRFIGDSQNNLKDMPLVFFFTAALFLFFLAYRHRRISLYLAAGVLTGLTYCIKINAVFIPALFLSWVVLFERPGKSGYMAILRGIPVAALSALAVIPLVWPYYRYDFIGRFIETYKTFSRHEWNERVLYLGEVTLGQELAWHFPFVMLAVTLPLFLLIAFGIGLFGPSKRTDTFTRSRISAVALLALWILLPTCAQAFSSAPMYDGIRHYLIVLPAIAILAAFGIQRILYCSRLYPAAGTAAVALAYSSLLFWNYKLHPYQIVFFNSLVGGEKRAAKLFDFDYWGASYKEGAAWLERNAKPGHFIWVPYGGYHFPLDFQRFTPVDTIEDLPDYKIALQRALTITYDASEDYRYPKRAPVYSVQANGADLLRIFKFEENAQLAKDSYIPPLNVSTVPLENGLLLRDVGKTENRWADRKVVNIGFQCPDNEYKDKETRMEYSGLLKIEAAGTYCFQVYSDDFSALRLNDILVLKNPSMRRNANSVELSAGWYAFNLFYVNRIGPGCLEFNWSIGDCSQTQPVPATQFYLSGP